jgi:hypothetical protein
VVGDLAHDTRGLAPDADLGAAAAVEHRVGGGFVDRQYEVVRGDAA